MAKSIYGIESRHIAGLKPLASREKDFHREHDLALTQLARDIKVNGLNDAVDILPDGTILDGHERVRAYLLLRWKKIRCCVHLGSGARSTPMKLAGVRFVN